METFIDFALGFPGGLIVGTPIALLIGTFFGWLSVRTSRK